MSTSPASSNGSSGPPLDELIARLRQRAADPELRVDVRQTEFSAAVTGLSLGEMLQGISVLGADIRRVVAANQAGTPLDGDLLAKADWVEAAMSTPAPVDLPAPADAAALGRAESELGFPLPPSLRRIYTEVANGGFGPGPGLLSIEQAVAHYRELGASAPVGQAWPDRLLPLVRHDPSYDCVDAASPSARMVTWDPEELEEHSSARVSNASFSEIAPSLEVWLDEWVSSRPAEEVFREQMVERMATSMVEDARRSRARIAAMTPEQRAAMGLPEVGWERVVWGGLGLEEDSPGQ
jgi:hypothetical protein